MSALECIQSSYLMRIQSFWALGPTCYVRSYYLSRWLCPLQRKKYTIDEGSNTSSLHVSSLFLHSI